ncbi:UNVERIFIED_CONTAM: Brefeldin A-inhibited guanine nucleotide-exchange protein 2 [Sesamum radiatum]|uniref:Brefeldin A-inhibited guanine nucleotide-exchange protein 2 n=1 Tax=Sesamum radiatum TaxID=300843 RepID=A0AAW2VLN2_SESRA
MLGPMLAAFSVPLDQSDDEVVIALCLEGFRSAIHVTAAMSMKTHRDAFVTSLAKFTSLHSPADIKQKNIDAIKVKFLPVLRKKGHGKIHNAASAVRRGSYDSAGIGGNVGAGITSEQMNNLVSNLNMLEQVGEVNRIFIRSQKLNSEAIIDFVKALCKVSMDELRSTSDPRVFSLTKIVEIAHYNMNRIRLVWSKIWQVFTTAAYDDHKNIVLLAFEIIEKIVRDYFPYITETETTTFTDCVNCLIAFTNTRFNKEISLNAIGFLKFCASKLAEGDLGKETSEKVSPSSPQKGKEIKVDNGEPTEKVDHLYLWFPLLAGLSELSFDPRPEIRKSALQLLFDTLRNYGQHFSLALWEKVFESVLFRIFDDARRAVDPSDNSPRRVPNGDIEELDEDAWLYETCTLALQLVVDLFVNFYDTVNPLLRKVLMLLVSFIKRPHQSLAGIGIAAFVRLMSNAGELFPEDKWFEVVSSLREAAKETLPDFSFVLDEDGQIWAQEEDLNGNNHDESAETITSNDDSDNNLRRHRLYAAISDVKCRAAIQLLLIQAVMEIYNMYRAQLSVKNTVILFDAVRAVAFHAHKINSDSALRPKLQELGSMTQMQDPPLLRLENESYQICLTLIQNLVLDRPPSYDESEVESYLVNLCQEVLQFYIDVAYTGQIPDSSSVDGRSHWIIPVGSGRRRELAARAPLIVATLQAICSLGDSSFEKNLSSFLPLLSTLISCEHGSNEVQVALSDMLNSSVGPVLLRLVYLQAICPDLDCRVQARQVVVIAA